MLIRSNTVLQNKESFFFSGFQYFTLFVFNLDLLTELANNIINKHLIKCAITVNFLNIRTPKKLIVITLKFELCGSTIK